MTSSSKSGLLLVVVSCRGVIAIVVSFFNNLLYDEVTDSPPAYKEITDAIATISGVFGAPDVGAAAKALADMFT